MIDIALLAYFPDPFGVQESRYMVREPEDDPRLLSARELSTYTSPIMTYDVPDLVDDLRKLNQSPPMQIVDLGDALRLLVARSKDDGGEKLWNVWTPLKRCFSSNIDGDSFEKVVESKAERPEPKEQNRLLREALKALRLQWKDLALELKRADEFERLVSIEWPLQGVFARRQFAGIRVDVDAARNLLDQISSEKYAAYREVAQALNMSPTGLTFWNIHPHLERTDVPHLVELNPGGRLQDAFELAAPTSRFASSFLSLIKSKRDESIVKRAMGGAERIYPVFQVLGTISARILVSDPYLQQLRRAYRTLVAADRDLRLVYLDYAQFEPGVLAGLAEDKRLIEAYNAGDVYTSLAEALFGNPRTRPIAKRVFLAFSYGMSPERIATILAGGKGSQTDPNAYETKITTFFEEFSMLKDYRIAQQTKLRKDGFVCSLLGNRRLRTSAASAGTLTLKEKRWSLNHPVQSTASLIFKEALIDIAREMGADSIILPMHDAILLQLRDDGNFNRNIASATEMMIAAYKRHFPNINARVTVGSFAE